MAVSSDKAGCLPSFGRPSGAKKSRGFTHGSAESSHGVHDPRGSAHRVVVRLWGTARENRNIPNVGKRLDELRDAGADPVMVLTGLAMIYPGAGPSTKRQFKVARKRLLDLANRLEKVAKEVELTVSDPLIYSEFWKILYIENGTDFTHAERQQRGRVITVNG